MSFRSGNKVNANYYALTTDKVLMHIGHARSCLEAARSIVLFCRFAPIRQFDPKRCKIASRISAIGQLTKRVQLLIEQLTERAQLLIGQLTKRAQLSIEQLV